MAGPFANVRTTVDRLYVNSGKSKLLSIMSFRGFRVWYYDLNFIFVGYLGALRLTVHSSRIKGIMIIGRDFRGVVRRSLCFALRAFVGMFFKNPVFFDVAALRSLWRADCNSVCFT